MRLFCDDLAERLRHMRPREEDPVEPAARERYLAALRAADGGDLAPLTRLWIDRLTDTL